MYGTVKSGQVSFYCPFNYIQVGQYIVEQDNVSPVVRHKLRHRVTKRANVQHTITKVQNTCKRETQTVPNISAGAIKIFWTPRQTTALTVSR